MSFTEMYRNTDAVGNPEIVRAGYLTKSPPGDAPPMSQWRRRWFVLCDSSRAYPLAERHVRLEYYQNEGDARKLCDPKGVIELKNCTRVSGVARLKGHNYVFDICTKERTYHIAAETPTEKYEWMRTLNELLFTPPIVSNGAKEIQDLEKAEMLRRRSVSKASAERQSSLGELTDLSRPTSCFIRPDMKSIDEHHGRQEIKKRPLPPTPDGIKASLTMQPPSSQPQTVPESPPPPVPKPRLRSSAENSKQLIYTPPPTNVTASLPSSSNCDFNQISSSARYENVPVPKVAPGYENINVNDEAPPPVPKPRQKSSLEDTSFSITSPSSNDSRTISPRPVSNSGYENVPGVPLMADYEDIDINEDGRTLNENHFNTSDRIIFLRDDIYTDLDVEKEEYYADPNAEQDGDGSSFQSHLEPSTYEVPVNLMTPSPIPPQRISNIHLTPCLPDTDNPPVPPPRVRFRRDSSIHRSLLDLADDGLYSELQSEEFRQSDDDDEHYGRLIRAVGGGSRERRFSDPEIMPISPRSHSSSPLFFSKSKPRESPPPVPPPYSNRNQQKHYYENTGYVPLSDQSRLTSSALSPKRS